MTEKKQGCSMTPASPDIQMTEEEYRKYPAMNFSSLASFYNKGVYSPDHALMEFKFKSYFEYGKMFETMLQDSIQGTDEFGERFYFTELENKMPDDLIGWIDNGKDLNEFYVYTKQNKLSGTYKGRHAYLDEALKNPGKIPVSKKEAELLKRHVSNMLKMRYQGVKVEHLLANAQWQVPLIWRDEDGEKKALVDCLVVLDDKVILIDIKTAASFQKFSYMLRDHYMIQDIHYTHGVNETMGYCEQMVFFVASKEAPFLCQPWTVDYGDVDGRVAALEEYNELCEAYSKWVQAGKPPMGWLPQQSMKYFMKY